MSPLNASSPPCVHFDLGFTPAPLNLGLRQVHWKVICILVMICSGVLSSYSRTTYKLSYHGKVNFTEPLILVCKMEDNIYLPLRVFVKIK